MNIRKAVPDDLSRIAEVYVFNNRISYLPISKDIIIHSGKCRYEFSTAFISKIKDCL